MPTTDLSMLVRSQRRYIATFDRGGGAVAVPIRAGDKEEAEHQARVLAQRSDAVLQGVRRQHWLMRRRVPVAPTVMQRERRSRVATLLAGVLFVVVAVVIGVQGGGLGS